VKPDSVLARTAREVMAAHAGGAGPRAGLTVCPVCGEPLPCASGRAAAEVLFAAGLAESSGLIDAARAGLGTSSPLGLPDSPAPQPSAAVGSSPVSASPGASPVGSSGASPVGSSGASPVGSSGGSSDGSDLPGSGSFGSGSLGSGSLGDADEDRLRPAPHLPSGGQVDASGLSFSASGPDLASPGAASSAGPGSK
jgi:hypothetical protein